MRLLPLSLILIIIHLVGCRSIQVDEDVDKNQFEMEFLYPVNNRNNNDIDHDNQKINQELIETSSSSSVRGGSIDDKTQPPPSMVLRASTMNQTFFKNQNEMSARLIIMKNTTSSLFSSSSTPLQYDDSQNQGLSLYLKILASVFYPIAMILGIGGNTLVLLIIVFLRFTKSVTTFFIINLAISDLIFALLCIPITFVTAYLFQYWPFSSFMCVFFNYMQNVSVTLTVYTLIWITIDKFWGLVKPLKLRMGIKICKWLIAISWIFSLVTSLPIAVFTKLINDTQFLGSSTDNNTTVHVEQSTSEYHQQGLSQCIELWPEEYQNLAQIYNVLLLLVQYFIPLIILSFCYAKIGLRLKKSKAPGESIQMRDAKMTESRRKILKMCFIMVLTFMVFWAPMHFVNVYRFYDKSIEGSKYFGDIFFVCHVLAVSRTFVNPFIYAWSNAKFRAGFKYFMCCYCFSSKHKHLIFERRNESLKTCSHFTRYSLYASVNSNNNHNNGSTKSTSNNQHSPKAEATPMTQQQSATSQHQQRPLSAAARRQRFRAVDHACGCRTINFSLSGNSNRLRLASNSSAPDVVRNKSSNGNIEF